MSNSNIYFGDNVLGEVVATRTYAAWNEKEQRRETWEEIVDRYMTFMRTQLESRVTKKQESSLSAFTEAEYAELRESILKMEVMPSMRLMQFAGKAAEKCNVCVFNCAYTEPENFKDLVDIMYLSLCGSGVGFSVEKESVEKFPTVSLPVSSPPHIIQVDDSREGWCDAFLEVLQLLWSGRPFDVDYSHIRPKGSRLKTMGGRSGGYEILKELINSTTKIVNSRRGQKIRPIDIHDIICHIGTISNNSAIRRSALISLSDLDDEDMRHAKDGSFWQDNPQRMMANNSAVYSQVPTAEQFHTEWSNLVASGSGERGIYNRYAVEKMLPERRKRFYMETEGHIPKLGGNPCVVASTWIHTSVGHVQVRDLIGHQFTAVVDGEQHSSTSTGFYLTGWKQVITLTLEKGKTLTLTPNHRVLTVRRWPDTGNGVFSPITTQWIQAGDLKQGDEIVCDKRDKGENWFGIGGTAEDGLILSLYMSIYSLTGGKEDKPLPYAQSLYYNMTNAIMDRWPDIGYSWEKLYNTATNYMVYESSHVVEMSSNELYEAFVGSYLESGEVWFLGVLHFWRQAFHAMQERLGWSSGSLPSTKVLSIVNERDVMPVYDCTIPTLGRFSANGLVVHNCGEIVLRSRQFCNLTEAICRENDTSTTLERKVRLATMLGTFQSSLCSFRYVDPRWIQNQEKERLLGVSLTGICDCPAIRDPELLNKLRDLAISTNEIYAKRMGINPSLSTTTIKPSGTVSTVVNSSSGIHARFSSYYLKNLRISKMDAVSKYLIASGVPYAPEIGQGVENEYTGEISPIHTYVFSFPIKAPEHAILASQLTAIEQIELALLFRKNYVEHSVSVSIYVGPNEWDEVGKYILEHFDHITGMSFFPRDDHVYPLAPWQKITREDYEKRMLTFPKLDMSKLHLYEKDVDAETLDAEKRVSMPACAGGICER